MVKVLFVCLGNICRSPLAEGIFRDMVSKEGLDGEIMIDSAGTSNWHINEPPDPRTIEVAEKNGIRIDHLGRQVQSPDLSAYDYILAMDQDNYSQLHRLLDNVESPRASIMLMRDFDNKQSGTDVPDPYYGGPDGFQHVHDLLRESLENFLTRIRKDHQL